jgi:hypothetical protein
MIQELNIHRVKKIEIRSNDLGFILTKLIITHLDSDDKDQEFTLCLFLENNKTQ